ncbi:MAG: CapA family protein, partial [Anaerolineaceae bacterium]
LKITSTTHRYNSLDVFMTVVVIYFLMALNGCFRNPSLDTNQIASPTNNLIVTPVTSKPTEKATPQITLPPSGQVTLMAVGDVMLSRSIGELILKKDPSAPFSQVDDLFQTADWVVANLECAITDSTQPEKKRYTFNAPLESAAGLAAAGINVVNLSNNHILDFGQAGLVDTLNALQLHSIKSFGLGSDAQTAHAPLILEKNGLSIALLAYTDVPIESSSYFDTRDWIADNSHAGLAWANLPDILMDVARAREQADLVIVYFHFGVENLDHASQTQHLLATGAIDAGAVLVLGSHTHRLQEIQHYKDGLILYGLGNFIFDGFDEASNLTAVLSVRLAKSGIVSQTWHPMVIEDGIPQPASPENSKVILSLVNREYKVFQPGIEGEDINE